MKLKNYKLELIKACLLINSEDIYDLEDQIKEISLSEDELKNLQLNNYNNNSNPINIFMESYFSSLKKDTKFIEKINSIEEKFNNSNSKEKIENLIFPSIVDLLYFSVNPFNFGYKAINQSLYFENELKEFIDNKEKEEILYEIQYTYLNQFQKELIQKKKILYKNMVNFIYDDPLFKNVQLYETDITSNEIIWFKENLPNKNKKFFNLTIKDLDWCLKDLKIEIKEQFKLEIMRIKYNDQSCNYEDLNDLLLEN